MNKIHISHIISNYEHHTRYFLLSFLQNFQFLHIYSTIFLSNIIVWSFNRLFLSLKHMSLISSFLFSFFIFLSFHYNFINFIGILFLYLSNNWRILSKSIISSEEDWEYWSTFSNFNFVISSQNSCISSPDMLNGETSKVT